MDVHMQNSRAGTIGAAAAREGLAGTAARHCCVWMAAAAREGLAATGGGPAYRWLESPAGADLRATTATAIMAVR